MIAKTNRVSKAKEMRAEYARCQKLIQTRLDDYFTQEVRFKTLLEAMRYSLLSGGKRIRAVICIEFCLAAGGDEKSALEAACAIEMLHAYSLIHDDLPCMDDSDKRRGLPSSHIKYGEANAMLAGDALQAAAFETLIGSGLPEAVLSRMVKILAAAAGAFGICGGQYLDLRSEGKQITPEELEEIHKMKTAVLIVAAAKLGVTAARGSPEQLKAADDYASSLGLAFQVRDDLLDTIAPSDELGKPTGADNRRAKATFASFYGSEECERIICAETEKAVAAIDGKFIDTTFLVWFAKLLADRAH